MSKLMSRISISIIVITLFTATVDAQSCWTIINSDNIVDNQYGERHIIPTKFTTSILETARLKKDLNKSPIDIRFNKEKSGTITLPLPDGSIEEFKVWYSPVMHPNLAAKYPDIKTYRVISRSNIAIYGRIGISKYGFHATLDHPDGQMNIDRYADQSHEVYISYHTKDQNILPDSSRPTSCGTEYDHAHLDALTEGIEPDYPTSKAGDPVFLKKYRLAIACTGEWGQNFGSAEEVLAEIVVGANRINQTMENEAAIFFELIQNNDELIFQDPDTDPYVINPNTGEGVHPGGQLLGQNTQVINNIIGSSAYDIGHCFTRSCTDGIGGVAAFGSICTGLKGAGITCVGNSSLTTAIVQTALHELGHQFGASHTWGNCTDASAGQYAAGTGFEPGSGTTHLSYAGGCNTNNVASTSDDYYHVASLVQMYNTVKIGNGSLCGEDLVTGNTTPDILLEYEDDIAIPIFTPFELDGSAFDKEGDALTYCWEQYNTGPVSELGSPIGNAPAFRSFPPTESSNRVFPSMNTLLANVSRDSEKLQDEGRDYNFMFTVRDNYPGAGIANWQEVEFVSSSNAGPFFLTSPNNNEQLVVGQPFEIQWEVSGTDQAPVNCQNVDIILSEDGGSNFDIQLATQTPNDGSQIIIVPNHVTTRGRILIKGSDNIFFDVSNFNFDINEPTVPSYFLDISDQAFDLCTPDVVTVEIESESFLGFAGEVTLDVTSDLPEGSIVTLSESLINPNLGSSTLTLDFSNINATGHYVLTLVGRADGAEDRIHQIQIELTSTDFSDLALIGPTNESSGVSIVPTFEWSDAINGVSYTLEVSDSPAFGETSIISESGILGTSYIPQITLSKNTVYYWKISSFNKCSNFQTALGTFATEALSCKTVVSFDLPSNISTSSTPTVSSTAFVSGSGQVSEVNIKSLDIRHDDAGELKVILTSPSLKTAVLIDGNCGFTRDIVCGFDDEAAQEITCPVSDGNTYRPLEPFSVFNGDDVLGDWVLSVEDSKPGNGGQFREFALEVCSNEVLEGPSLINNVSLEVPTNGANRLNNDLLLTTDENNTSDEITYTIVSVPTSGDLTISGETAVIGSAFTQLQIEEGRIRYDHHGNAETTDIFTFTINDGEGGWIPTTEYLITIGEGFASNTEDEYAYFAVDVYPNPAHDYLTIEINTEINGNYNIGLYDLAGRLLMSEQQTVDNKILRHIEATTLPSGMILIKIQNGAEQIIKMTSIQH